MINLQNVTIGTANTEAKPALAKSDFASAISGQKTTGKATENAIGKESHLQEFQIYQSNGKIEQVDTARLGSTFDRTI